MANISTDFSTWSGTAASNQPDSGDAATVQADLQAIQAAIRTVFPAINGVVLPTHTELNYVDGVTGAIQTQLNAKVSSAEVQNQSPNSAVAGGTATVATATPSPAYGAVAARQRINLAMPNAANGVAMTLQLTGQAALPCLNQDGSLVSYPANYKAQWELNEAANTWILLNPPAVDEFVPFSAVSASNILTLTVNPNVQDFRSATLNSGARQRIALSTAATLAIPVGATLGAPAAITSASATMAGTATLTLNAAPSAPVQVGAVIYQAGTRIGKVSALNTYVGGVGTGTLTLDATATFTAQAIVIINPMWIAGLEMANGEVAVINLAGARKLDETGLISTTAISAGSTAANVFYSTTARTNQPYKLMFLAQISNPTVGTYSTQPEIVYPMSASGMAYLLSGAGTSWGGNLISTQRVAGQTYRNLNPYPISVSIITATNAGNAVGLTINGESNVLLATNSNASGTTIPLVGEIPSGHTYVTGGAGTVNSWYEKT
jgi:hypothetical protein